MTCLQGCVPTNCFTGFGLAHAVKIPTIANANWQSISSCLPQEGRLFTLGRDMKTSHTGMGITKADYAASMRCLSMSLDKFNVSGPERSEVVAFVTSLEPEIVEA